MQYKNIVVYPLGQVKHTVTWLDLIRQTFRIPIHTQTATEFMFSFTVLFCHFVYVHSHTYTYSLRGRRADNCHRHQCDGVMVAQTMKIENIMPTVEHIIITNSFIYSGVMVRCKMTKHYLCHLYTHTHTKARRGNIHKRKEINKKGIKTEVKRTFPYLCKCVRVCVIVTSILWLWMTKTNCLFAYDLNKFPIFQVKIELLLLLLSLRSCHLLRSSLAFSLSPSLSRCQLRCI